MKEIKRFEFISKKGREIVKYGKFKYDIQDNGNTLKIFSEDNNDR